MIYPQHNLSKKQNKAATTNTLVAIQSSKRRKLLKKETDQQYCCLCVSLNKVFPKSTLLMNLFGFPIYCWVFIILMLIGGTCVIGWLTYNVVSKEKNTSYYVECKSNSDCNSQIGLQCATQDNWCNCPVRNIKGRCDCSSGYYWDGRKCSRTLEYQENGCISDYSCDQTRNLKCINSTCTCVLPQMWNLTTQSCDFSFLGCFYETTAAATGFRGYALKNMYYFVDMCLDYCQKGGYKYASASISTNNYCGCYNAVSNTTSAICDTLSQSLNGKYYYCGLSTGNTYTRAYYAVN